MADDPKSFEVDGFFWLPQAPDERVAGVLSFDPEEGGSLSLIGTLGSDLDFGSDEVREIRVIQGEGERKGFTLEGCLVRSQTSSFFGDVGRQRLGVSRIVEGAHYDDTGPVEVDMLVVSYTYLMEWSGLNGIVASNEQGADDGSTEFSIRYKTLDDVECALPRGAGSVRLRHRVSRRVASYGPQIVNQHMDSLFEFRKPIPLEAALEYASDLQDLLLIANDRVVAFENVRFSHPDMVHQSPSGKTFRAEATLHVRWRAQADVSPRRRHTYHDMCFNLLDIGGASGIEQWMRTARRFRTQVGRVSATRTQKGIYVQDALLGRVAALESLHRARYPKRTGSTRSGKPRDLYLTERLDDLMSDAGRPFWRMFDDKKSKAAPRMQAWRDRAKDERNNVAHHLGKEVNSGIEELYYVSEAAYFLFAFAILRAANAPKAVFGHFVEHSRYRHASSHLRKFFR